jgi:hypothetical protein
MNEMAATDEPCRCHIVAVPYPGRGHVNAMLSLSRLLAARGAEVTFVVTEEWLGLILSSSAAAPLPAGVRLRAIPNVIPSEHGRGADHAGFLDAVATEMEAPFCTQLFPHIQAKSKLLHARHAYDATATREAGLVSQLEELSCGKRRSLLDKFLPLLDILATRVRVVRRLRELLTTKFPPGTFPVKVTFSLLLCSSGNASSCTLLTLCIMYA